MSRGSRLHTATSSVTKTRHIAQAHADNIVLYNNNLQFSIRKDGDKHVCFWHVKDSKSAILSHFCNYCTQKAMLSKLSRENLYCDSFGF